ncbi:ABC transporter substrate-binding protein [Clostridium sp. SHJSY1]|uniref:substrate-binding periplasmic protein n=1 Tax=Clostridium sp. SHJSY1 TaxID=2942483 RepID=UPI002875574E|nr:ABC transporter substrate-binding protein [Clostridium sp. SHJSY1]MDS0526061.1 ABC transporter substrate-binding protein [Clostridium sp. SHJSY1]
MKNYLKCIIPMIVILNFAINVRCEMIKVSNENRAVTEEFDRLQKIKEKGVLTILSPNEEFYSYKEPKSGSLHGLDADIIKEIAKRLEIKDIAVKYVAFPNILEEFINNTNIDLIAQGLYITDERKNLMNFTNPIYIEKDAVITRQDSNINNKEDLKNAKIGLVGGTVYELVAKNWKKQGLLKDYLVFFDYGSLQLALENKIVDAVLTESIIAENSVATKSKLKILSPNKYKAEINFNVGYPVKKEDTTLLNEINEKLQEMKKDGTVYDILAKYGAVSHYIP